MIVAVSDAFRGIYTPSAAQFPITYPKTETERMAGLLRQGWPARELRIHEGRLQFDAAKLVSAGSLEQRWRNL